MGDNLQAARRLAKEIRFSGDIPDAKPAKVSAAIRNFFLANELQISPVVTPALYKNLNSALENMLIPKETAAAFVYASSEMQAMCFGGDERGCLIRFSSGLVDILDAEEFNFVVGHEIGHFLFGHHPAKKTTNGGDLEYLMRRRAQEISCDRMGLVACGGSVHVAIKALMKTVSGLTGEHIHFNVAAFMAQLKDFSGNFLDAFHQSTHPSVLIRCRALLWFSLNDYFGGNSGKFSETQLSDLDKKIKKDIAKYIDAPAHKTIEKAKHDVEMWLSACAIVRDNVFDKKEQEKFAKDYGQANLRKLKAFLSGMPGSKIKSAVATKLEEAKSRLKNLIPRGYKSALMDIEKKQKAENL